jgi:uncharacterized membrane protein YhhN
MKKNLLYIVLVFYIAYLETVWLKMEAINYFLKPLLIPMLITYTATRSNFSGKGTLIKALVMSTLGDVLLLFSDIHQLFFISGLISFLIAHVIYIRLFLKKLNARFSIIWAFSSLVFLGIYLFFFLATMWGNLKTMKIPVSIYALVISAMLFVVIQLVVSKTLRKGEYVLFGALLFVSSDSLLAWNMFYQEINHGSFWVMSTYLFAQLFIVYGWVNSKKKEVKE